MVSITGVKKDANAQDIVIFDLDFTITHKDSYVEFLKLCLIKNPFRLFRCGFLPFAVVFHKLGLRNNSWLKETFLSAIAKGITRKELNQMAAVFAEKIIDTGVYSQAQRCVNQHKLKGDMVLLASASFDFYVKPLSKRMFFDEVICTKAEFDQSDRLTGKILGHNCYGEHKKQAILQYLVTLSGLNKIIAYSDHESDLPMFSLADKAIAVNPSKKLIKGLAGRNIIIKDWR